MKQNLEFKIEKIKILKNGEKIVLTFDENLCYRIYERINNFGKPFILKFDNKKYIHGVMNIDDCTYSFLLLKSNRWGFVGTIDIEKMVVSFKNFNVWGKGCKIWKHKKFNCDVCGVCKKCWNYVDDESEPIFYNKKENKKVIKKYIEIFGLDKKTKNICDECFELGDGILKFSEIRCLLNVMKEELESFREKN